jgi:HlyD family secretion protein
MTKTSNINQAKRFHKGTGSVDKSNNKTSSISGAGMDRKISNKTSPFKKYAPHSVALIVLFYFVYQFLNTGGRSLTVDHKKIQISIVTNGVFEDFIPVRGRVTPAKTLYLDAIDGGRVERILVEDGASLIVGDLIVELSNASLQLSVLSNEAQVAEQLNNMRSIELSLEQNRLQHKSNLIDIRYQIKLLTRQVNREENLVETGAVARFQFADTQDSLEWYKNRLEITLESQASDSKMQAEQLEFLKETSQRLEANLNISRQNLDNMNVKAPVKGKLSGFNVEVGQSIAPGERLGQIDTPNDYKLTANIDEFYLGRVDLKQKAKFEEYQLEISKIYPQVQNGQFKVDFTFVGAQPQRIRRGQTVQMRLTLGDASQAILIPNGSFYQDTGGNWIFVVTADVSLAVKRKIKLGRRNSRYIEVLDGLEVGERVVTSPYNGYQDMQQLKLNN